MVVSLIIESQVSANVSVIEIFYKSILDYQGWLDDLSTPDTMTV